MFVFNKGEYIIKCVKCGSNVFFINNIDNCCECKYNPAWNEQDGEYTYDKEKIKSLELTRNSVYEEGECMYGSAGGGGCMMITCTKCKHKFNIPTVDY